MPASCTASDNCLLLAEGRAAFASPVPVAARAANAAPFLIKFLRLSFIMLISCFYDCCGFHHRGSSRILTGYWLAAPPGCQYRTRNIHQWAKNGRGEAYRRDLAHLFGNPGGQATVLHADFNGDCPAIFFVEIK